MICDFLFDFFQFQTYIMGISILLLGDRDEVQLLFLFKLILQSQFGEKGHGSLVIHQVKAIFLHKTRPMW